MFTTQTVLHHDDQKHRRSHPECELGSMESASQIQVLPRTASRTARCERNAALGTRVTDDLSQRGPWALPAPASRSMRKQGSFFHCQTWRVVAASYIRASPLPSPPLRALNSLFGEEGLGMVDHHYPSNITGEYF